MRWIVGLDLRPQGAGAVQLVRWLADGAVAPGQHEFIGVHVVVPSGDASRDDVLDEVLGRRLERTEASLREAAAREAFARVDTVAADDPATGLAEAARHHRADGIIIGRQAPTDGHALVRLGRCARRLIRSLPAAVMVVPPESKLQDFGAGPVMVASDLRPASDGAARQGLAMARALGRDLLVVSAWHPPVRASAEWDSLVGMPEEPDPDPDATEQWLVERGLGGATGVRERGDPVEVMLRLGEERDAALLVCGSRHLSLAKRIVVASTGTDLARVTRRPVLVVPPELAE